MSVVAAINALRAYLEEERDFNAKWALLHELGEPAIAGPEGRTAMAVRRREVVAERQSWIDALDSRAEIPDELASLRRTVERQNAALMHWRREADRDAGRLRRMNDALFRIANGGDDLETVRKIAREQLEVL